MITKDVGRVVDELQQGRIAAVPTETVYGLAAKVDCLPAIESVFQTKARPHFDPLILHVHNSEQAKTYVNEWPDVATNLAEKFWPGPLTMILKKNERVDSLITAGRNSVGLRVPGHPMALEILQKLNTGFVAPSANRFKKTSPTSASHVLMEFPQANFPILDGGDCKIGIESTVIEIRENEIAILRPGMIGASHLRDVSGWKITHQTSEAALGLAPGAMNEHYQPEVPLTLVSENHPAENLQSLGSRIDLENDPLICARLLYSKLKALSKNSASSAYVIHKVSQKGEAWDAIWDRLTKAASFDKRSS